MSFIIGCDEVGYGALAGPLVICGVRAPKRWSIPGLKDSKAFSSKSKRTAIAAEIQKRIDSKEIECYLAERTNLQIDTVGVGTALKDAFVETFNALYLSEDRIITDGILNFSKYKLSFKVESIVKADSKFPTVMAASIYAKAYRDNKMKEFHKQHSKYGWDENAGYASKDHREALEEHGPCELHRFSYAPMKNMKLIDPRQTSFQFK